MKSQNPINEPVPIQIAIQGGGAKLVNILAVMDALEDLEAEKMLKVTRLAGTSAGALIGCLFAAGVKMSAIRTYLRTFTPKSINKIFPQNKNITNIYRLMVKGKPLWDENLIRSQLSKWFSDENITLFEHFKKRRIEVQVIAANLTTSDIKIFKEPKESIVEAVLASCGLPYFFRIWGQGGEVIVDGGICDNFPASILLDSTNESNQEDFGEIIGITFQPISNKQPTNLVNFTTALLETSMNTSIERAKRRLGSDRVFVIETDVTTFEFDKALNSLESQYTLMKTNAKRFFSDYVKNFTEQSRKQVVKQETWDANSTSILEGLYKIYVSNHEASKLNYKLGRLVVYAHSLVTDTNSLNYGLADRVDYLFKFHTADKPIYCHGIGLKEPNHDITIGGDTEVALYDKDGNMLELVILPMKENQSNKSKSLLLSFVPFLRPNTGHYTLTCKEHIKDLMKPLFDKGFDYLCVNPLRANTTIDKIEIILCVPKNFGEIDLTCNIPGGHSRLMKAGELADLYLPENFKAFGWSVTNSKPDEKVRVDYQRRYNKTGV